ncbi:uncharacterized protein PV09_02683 [Verruconis gallopava]|uniref:CFEM domain-containing protein n=1 Tax=Verruconis gallopava TaxID=253628 RepID=A0A0D1XTV5_9PEZI|nr:uncharacterized protein PV09_02683 [Verruconis gallopava]KIW06206.1 hypothetical protein PV09_02683 [Verruconis gallopava]
MKYSIAFVAGAALVAAQDLSSIPQCGQMCITNMLGVAGQLGCSSSNITCLCADPRFGYGLRDCTNQACGAEVYSAVASYGLSICSAAGVTAGGAGAAASTGASGVSGSSTPVSTEAVVTTISSGGSAVATSTIGSTTLYSIAGAAGVQSSLSGSAASASSSVASALSSAESSASSASESASAQASSAAGSASSAASSASSSAKSSSSSGLAPAITAAPILGGAALAALLMV